MPMKDLLENTTYKVALILKLKNNRFVIFNSSKELETFQFYKNRSTFH